ncbi:MAG: NADH dehydrogenase [Candidatus Hydrogenedentes bacterium]|nr:NADH dehydrogenase [Candidatus Hydrogenedentota bacterium]
MMDLLFLQVLSFLLVLVGLVWAISPLRRFAWLVSLAIPLTCIGWTFLSPGEITPAPWFLMGAHFGLDAIGRPLLALTASIWFAAGIYSRGYLKSQPDSRFYWFFFSLTMAGNLGLLAALDAGSYLTWYTMMSVAAYGLIIHDRKPASIRAGRVYMALTVLGEMLIFAGIAFAVRDSASLLFEDIRRGVAESPNKTLVGFLILTGFGIKLGVMPLHFWLPLAHPAAPTPASAVLSGVMIKTGLVGMLRVLPFGDAGFELLGPTMIVAGLGTAFLAAIFGTTQSNIKAVLAYSSVSQMGLVTTAAGAALLEPGLWIALAPALLWFVLHHAVAKVALFMGCGVVGFPAGSAARRIAITAGLGLAALSIAGLPLTTGFVAKQGLKSALGQSAWGSIFDTLLPLTGITTTLLMARFLYLARPKNSDSPDRLPFSMLATWGILTAGAGINWIWAQPAGIVSKDWLKFTPTYVWTGLWPILGAALLAAALLRLSPVRKRLSRIEVPQGDLVVPISFAVRGVLRALAQAGRCSQACSASMRQRLSGHIRDWPRLPASRLAAWLESEYALLPLLCAISLLMVAILLA